MNDTDVLDQERLHDVTLGDRELMREIVETLVDEASRQLELLSNAITQRDVEECARLAHYSKGACANVGACSAAALLARIEASARQCRFAECDDVLQRLSIAIDQLRSEAATI